jgi:hypothetical protein
MSSRQTTAPKRSARFDAGSATTAPGHTGKNVSICCAGSRTRSKARSGAGYYAGSHGEYAAMENFDVRHMTQDLAKSYPDVPGEVIEAFVLFAVYLYYLR